MGCGYRREEGQGKKAEVARGGWAEDARRPPATSLVSASIRLLGGNWGRVGAFGTNLRRWWGLESKKNRTVFQVSRGAPERGARYSRGQCSAHPFRLHRRNFGAGLLIQRVSPGRDSVQDGACEGDFRKWS